MVRVDGLGGLFGGLTVVVLLLFVCFTCLCGICCVVYLVPVYFSCCGLLLWVVCVL